MSDPTNEESSIEETGSFSLTESRLNDPLALKEQIYQIWWRWADFHLYILTPHIDRVFPPTIIEPEVISDNEFEFVYPIHDAGYRLSTSKSQNMWSAGMSMCKLFFTIEKMITILIDRLNSEGINAETEVQVAFGGHEIAQRKAFESIINLNYNVLVTNFEPGTWGEHYLENVKRMSIQYGYPPEAPRDVYKKAYNATVAGIKR